MGKYEKIRSEVELRKEVAKDIFTKYDYTLEEDAIDFRVANSIKDNDAKRENYMWAESKLGTKANIYESFVQLILTLRKHGLHETEQPPLFLGAFDAEKIAFLPYQVIADDLYLRDFNWKVTPSNYNTKEFKLLYSKEEEKLKKNAIIFKYDDNAKELKDFIANNFRIGPKSIIGTQISAENFTFVYQRWLQDVKPSIKVDWDFAYHNDILPADFYLADVLSRDNESLNKNLFVLLEKTKYSYDLQPTPMGVSSLTVGFQDNQEAHKEFWKLYKRPPEKVFWDEIIRRRDLLVPREMRERKGAFFTPPQWVKLSQKYLTKVLGNNWQYEYYVWDCAGGTGNLVAGLKNKDNVFVSTLDIQDVKVMCQRIDSKQLNLWPSHVFQFDFLNDVFDKKLPKELKEIIDDPEKRKKLIIYINPPYAEASSFGARGKSNVANRTETFKSYKDNVGAEALSELFAQFFIKIYKEISGCFLCSFCTPKFLNSIKYERFRKVFKVEYMSGFMCPAYTFDNVDSPFPIGFFVFNTNGQKEFEKTELDVFDEKSTRLESKTFYSLPKEKLIPYWRKQFYDSINDVLAQIIIVGPTIFSNDNTFITSQAKKSYVNKKMVANITPLNLIPLCVYATVRNVIKITWKNNRDVYLYPKESWGKDTEFQSDCLAYTLFSDKNDTQSGMRINHWIPFTEEEVGAKDKFESHFMSDYINGKMKPKQPRQLELDFGDDNQESMYKNTRIIFSPEAQAVMDAGRELWRYYLTKPSVNLNATYYDIRQYFQGVNEKGNMISDSKDKGYKKLIKNLRECLKVLGKKIEPKVYEHGFLLK